MLEHEPIPGKEEYLNSEKYDLRVRDWNKPGNIKDYIGGLNRIRRGNPALLQTSKLRFAQIDDKDVIGFVKELVDGHNAVAVAVALAKDGPREFWFHFGDIEIGPPDCAPRQVHSKPDQRRAAHDRMGWRWFAHRPQQDPALFLGCLT